MESGRFRRASGWPDRFRPQIAAGPAQAKRVAQAIPGPVELQAEHFAHNPLVHALFASGDGVRRCMRASVTLRSYAGSGFLHEAYALIAMRREQKRMLGLEERWGILRGDVPQQVVAFTDHHIVAPAPSLAEARVRVAWILFERFLERLAVGSTACGPRRKGSATTGTWTRRGSGVANRRGGRS